MNINIRNMKSYFLVYDRKVGQFAESYAKGLDNANILGSLALDISEQDKSLATVEMICSHLQQAGADRDSCLLCVGGGICSDICGFAASIFKRGIGFEVVPTTLLAQVDASIGGKNGVNFNGIKNSLGCFRIPDHIHFFQEPLNTLPEKEIKNGIVEMLKTFLLFEPELYRKAVQKISTRKAGIKELFELGQMAGRLKMQIVDMDPREKGPRILLNLGHTLGHAIEWWASCKGVEMSHGQAVGIGIVQIHKLAARQGLCNQALADRLEKDFRACRLDTDLPCSLEELRPAFKQDKKRSSGKLRIVFLTEIGNPAVCEMEI